MDKDKIPYRQLPEDACLTEQQLFGYMDGTLSYPEQHAVEKHLLDCDFCTDALAGLELVTDRTRIAAVPPVAAEQPTPPPIAETKNTKGRIIPFYRSGRTYAAAAALILIIGITWFFNTTSRTDSENQLSDNAVVTAPESAKQAESPAEEKTLADSLAGNATANEQQIAINEPVKADDVTPGMDGDADYRKNSTAGANDFESVPKPVAAAEGKTDYNANYKAKSADKKSEVLDESLANRDDAYARKEESKLKEDLKKERAGDVALNAEMENSDLVTANKITSDSSKYMLANGGSVALTAPAVSGTTYTWSDGAATPDTLKTVNLNTVGFSAPQANYTISQTPAQVNEVTVTSKSSTFDLFKVNTGKKAKAAPASSARSGEAQPKAPQTDNEKYNRAVTEINNNQNESALLILNDILTNKASPLYADAQWQKAVVLIKLNKKAEAKTILQEIVKKGGKYKPLAESQLKQL